MLRSSATLRLVFVFTAILAALVAGYSEGAERKPNLVLIFADDLGWRDVGYQSDGAFLTPHIDRLAAGGMVFTDAYATAGNCAPSRACLLSGTYTPRHHVYAVGSTDRGPDNLKRLVPVPNKSGLPKEVVTLAEALKAAGYATGHFGKWHLAGPDGAKPSEQGFDATYDSFGDGEVKEGSEGNKKGPPEDPKGVFTLTRKACDFMEANKDRPFFVYLPHHAIHGPLQMRPETAALMTKEGAKSKVSASYRGCTYDMDASVGMLLEKLKALGLEKDTLVVFTSDNGATPGSPQEPLRGNKGCYYEGGIREPFIASWYRRDRGGREVRRPDQQRRSVSDLPRGGGREPRRRARCWTARACCRCCAARAGCSARRSSGISRLPQHAGHPRARPGLSQPPGQRDPQGRLEAPPLPRRMAARRRARKPRLQPRRRTLQPAR
ncbi:MAG: sulfatase-like hydrolase/transferase [Verrucomicrobiales bacterium]